MNKNNFYKIQATSIKKIIKKKKIIKIRNEKDLPQESVESRLKQVRLPTSTRLNTWPAS